MKLTIPDFSKASLLVVGDVMLDRYWFGHAGRISPEAPVPIVQIQRTEERPGGAANVALNIAALGANVSLLGVVGKDEAANSLIAHLEAAGVKQNLLRSDTVETIVKLRVLSQHQQLIRLDFEAAKINFDSNILLQRYQAQLSHADVVIFSDYGKGTLSDIQKMISMARAAKIPVFVDPKGLDFTIYRGAQLMTPNYKEFEAVVGHCENEEMICRKAKKMIADYALNALLITRGGDGMTLFDDTGATHHIPAWGDLEVFDVTGAGDTVISVIGTAMASGASLYEAVTLSNVAAGISISRLGAAAVSHSELVIELTNSFGLERGCLSQDQLKIAVDAARQRGEKIVFTNGCFDILHAGHVGYLESAKELGDRLIVAINDDASIRRAKGPGRPIHHQDHRMAVLAGLASVDWVVTFSEETPEALLEYLKPDILAKGVDYSLEGVVGKDIVLNYGGEIALVGPPKVDSTSSIIERCADKYS